MSTRKKIMLIVIIAIGVFVTSEVSAKNYVFWLHLPTCYNPLGCGESEIRQFCSLYLVVAVQQLWGTEIIPVSMKLVGRNNVPPFKRIFETPEFTQNEEHKFYDLHGILQGDDVGLQLLEVVIQAPNSLPLVGLQITEPGVEPSRYPCSVGLPIGMTAIRRK